MHVRYHSVGRITDLKDAFRINAAIIWGNICRCCSRNIFITKMISESAKYASITFESIRIPSKIFWYLPKEDKWFEFFFSWVILQLRNFCATFAAAFNGKPLWMGALCSRNVNRSFFPLFNSEKKKVATNHGLAALWKNALIH